MSTILKALKKLETEPSRPVGSPLMARPRGTQTPIGIPFKPVQVMMAAALAGLCIIILSVAGWINPQNMFGHHDADALKPAALPASSPSEIPDRSIANNEAGSQPAQPLSIPEPLPEAVTGPAGAPPIIAPDSITTTSIPTQSDTTSLDQPAKHDMIADKSKSPFPTHAEAIPNSSANVTETRFDNSPVITEKTAEETGLKIDAIAWSEASERRLAVINGHILREGDAIDTVHIQHIGMEEVVFNDGTTLWKITFRID